MSNLTGEYLYLIYKEAERVQEVTDEIQGYITTQGPWIGHLEAIMKPAVFMNKWTGVLAETIDGISFYFTGKVLPGSQ